METTPQAPATPEKQKSYRVLARKYRPHNFSQLVGQDALVTTLTNAIKLGRVAQAFMLTGVRGVGKTSTARIIAKGLNCSASSEDDTPRIEPCNQCENCLSISAGKHIDVLEMDAASNTGVDDVREIIEGSAYRPVASPYKIYIIDEVHMLSKNAFNALLKTLEEPPENVKFIFATTEIRKVPATILSRCQRFDLRRVKTEPLTQHLATISSAEHITAEPASLKLIAKAAEGSVRDALSMLDQAAAMGADTITEQAVIDMLGQAGAGQILNLLEACLAGQAAEALRLYDAADFKGAEPEIVLTDMLEMIHQASLSAAGATLDELPESQLAGISQLAQYGIAKLGRSWQLLLNGYNELRQAPDSRAAAKMVLIRLAHIAPMPSPAEIIKKLPDALHRPTASDAAPSSSDNHGEASSSITSRLLPEPPQLDISAASRTDTAHPAASPEPQMAEQPPASPPANITSDSAIVSDVMPAQSTSPEADNISPITEAKCDTLEDIVQLCETKGEYILASHLTSYIRPITISDNKMEIQLAEGADDKFVAQLAKYLSQWTARQWLISLKNEGGGETLSERQEKARQSEIEKVSQEPLVAAVLHTFPSATVTAIHKNDDTENTDSPSLTEKR